MSAPARVFKPYGAYGMPDAGRNVTIGAMLDEDIGQRLKELMLQPAEQPQGSVHLRPNGGGAGVYQARHPQAGELAGGMPAGVDATMEDSMRARGLTAPQMQDPQGHSHTGSALPAWEDIHLTGPNAKPRSFTEAQAATDAQAGKPPGVKDPFYQRQGLWHMSGLNPMSWGSAPGRRRAMYQMSQAPLGGHVRRAAEGAEMFGHKITPEEALNAERALAAVAYGGVGSVMALAAIDALNGNEQSPGTIPIIVR